MNGRLKSNVVVNGGMLSGVGNINGNVTNQRWRDGAGELDRQLHDQRQLDRQSNGVWEIEIKQQRRQRPRARGDGSATFNGGTIEVVAAPGTYMPNSTYTILSASRA